VLQRCLAKDPEDRWQSARDLKAALGWAAEMPHAPIRPKSTRRWWPAAVMAVVLGAVGGWSLEHFRPPVFDDRILRFSINLPEGGQFILGTNRGGIAISPDGRTAAFVAKITGQSGLWVQPLDGTTARLIPGTESAAYPFWSPDGKALAFFAETGAKLERVDLSGGGVLAICDMPALARGGTWIQDQIIFGAVGSGLFRVSAAGGTPSPLTNLDTSRGEYSHGWPQMLPHDRVLYWVQSSHTEESGVYVSQLSKPGERMRLLTTTGNALYVPGAGDRDYLLWLRGTTLVAQNLDPGTLKFSGELYALAEPVTSATVTGHLNAAVSSTGLLLYSGSSTLSQFTWMDRTGKRLGAIGGTGEYTSFRLSPNGRRAAAALNGVSGSDLWILELERGVATRFTSHPGSLFPIWSPDGGTILFQNGAASMSRKEASGVGADQSISQSSNLRGPLDWSRDGRFVLYFEITPGTNRDLWILPVTPGGKPTSETAARPYLRTPFSEWHGRFSPEPSPKWVAYQSNESGRYEVYIDSFPDPRHKIRVSTEGGQYPQWGPGARELFYVSPDYKLMSVSLKLGTDSVEPSAPHELFPLPAIDDGLSSPYDVASDGQRFLVRATPEQQAPQALNVIVNWPALVKKSSTRP
jgi:Tol biopolymer transport system component